MRPADAAQGERLLRHLAAQRRERLARLQRTLASDRYFDLLDRLVEAAHEPRLLPGAERPAAEVLTELVAQPWQKLRKAARKLGKEPSDEELHALRIKAKRTRYASEAAARAIPKAADFAARGLRAAGRARRAARRRRGRGVVAGGRGPGSQPPAGVGGRAPRGRPAPGRGRPARGVAQGVEAPRPRLAAGLDGPPWLARWSTTTAWSSPPAAWSGGRPTRASRARRSRCSWCTDPATSTGASRRASASPPTPTTRRAPCARWPRRPATRPSSAPSCRAPPTATPSTDPSGCGTGRCARSTVPSRPTPRSTRCGGCPWARPGRCSPTRTTGPCSTPSRRGRSGAASRLTAGRSPPVCRPWAGSSPNVASPFTLRSPGHRGPVTFASYGAPRLPPTQGDEAA